MTPERRTLMGRGMEGTKISRKDLDREDSCLGWQRSARKDFYALSARMSPFKEVKEKYIPRLIETGENISKTLGHRNQEISYPLQRGEGFRP